VICIGVDSAEVTGLAVVTRDARGERLVLNTTVTIAGAADVESAAKRLAVYSADVVVVEEPFVHPRNPATGLVLARLLGRWLQAFEVRGLTCVTTPASMWQPAMLSGLLPARADRGARKAAALRWVRSTFGVEVTEDEADAITMATYVLRNATRKAA
jgi:Holliday junction resolvasome RuvABC endonuclease subunit